MWKNKILIHVCCGVCALNVIDDLKDSHDIALYFYNPNIFPREEYLKRKHEIVRYSKNNGLSFYDGEYNEDYFYSKIAGFEGEKEGQNRCRICFDLRLYQTALKARELGISAFTTTLTISPHKKSSVIFEVGQEVEKKTGINFLAKDFKKNDGFKKTMVKARSLEFYIQNYCGCEFSLNEKKEKSMLKK